MASDLKQPSAPLLGKLLGPAKSTKNVLETLDEQYLQEGKPRVYFLPLTEPIAPHFDELLGPVPGSPAAVAIGEWEKLLQVDAELLPTLLSVRITQFAARSRLADVAQAGDKLRELANEAKPGPANEQKGGMLYNSVRAHSLCAGLVAKDKPDPTEAQADKEKYLDPSLSCLKEAIDGGFENFDHMRMDTDLTPLHGLPEFEVLFPTTEPPKPEKNE